MAGSIQVCGARGILALGKVLGFQLYPKVVALCVMTLQPV